MSIQQMLMVSARDANATGGTITYSGKWQIHTFTSSGNFQFTYINNLSLPVRILVANGGASGQNGQDVTESDIGGVGGNGASAGQYQYNTSYTANSLGLTSRAVVVGGASSSSSFFSLSGNTAGGSGGLGGAGSTTGSGGSGNPGGNGVELISVF